MLAACGGHESIISLLIKLQADVNASIIGSERDGQTALMMAAADGHASSDSTQQPVPILRLLYSFHSSGTEIRQLLGR
jgi:hypothetical protein